MKSISLLLTLGVLSVCSGGALGADTVLSDLPLARAEIIVRAKVVKAIPLPNDKTQQQITLDVRDYTKEPPPYATTIDVRQTRSESVLKPGAEYLIFLQRKRVAGKQAWTTISGLPPYPLDAKENVLGWPAKSGPAHAATPYEQVRQEIGDLLHRARLAQVQAMMAQMRGMTRAQVHKLFPQEDGGLVGSNLQRYYAGSEVMVDVPFDQTGGPFKPQNRVNGPVKVYRSMMHLD